MDRTPGSWVALGSFALALTLLGCGGGTGVAPDAATGDTGGMLDAGVDVGPDDAGGTHDGGGDDAGRFAALAAVIEGERRSLGAPGVAVAVVEDGVVTYAAGFGVTRLGGSSPVLPTTRFAIGSVTKPLTAIGLLRLVDGGLVDLDAPVVDYIPELRLTRSAAELPSMTVRHLLTQSSGLPDEPVVWTWPDTSDSVLDSYLTSATFADLYDVMSPPGRMFYYSNLGFDLAGLIIERVSGRPYADYMRDEVFARLGMDRATFRTAEVSADGDYAWGTAGGRAVTPIQSAPPWQRPSGLAITSVLDLAQVARFVMDGDPAVLSPAVHDAMLTPQRSTEAHLDRIQQSLGFVVFHGYPSQAGLLDYDLTTIGHGGSIMGDVAHVLVVPARRFAFVFVTNLDGAWFDRSAEAALDLALALPAAPLAVAAEDPARFADYVGTYAADTGKSGGGGNVVVTLDAAGLHMTYPPSGACDLVPRTVGNFACPNPYPFPISTLTFLRDASGNVEYLRAIGLGFTARRL